MCNNCVSPYLLLLFGGIAHCKEQHTDKQDGVAAALYGTYFCFISPSCLMLQVVDTVHSSGISLHTPRVCVAKTKLCRHAYSSRKLRCSSELLFIVQFLPLGSTRMVQCTAGKRAIARSSTHMLHAQLCVVGALSEGQTASKHALKDSSLHKHSLRALMEQNAHSQRLVCDFSHSPRGESLYAGSVMWLQCSPATFSACTRMWQRAA